MNKFKEGEFATIKCEVEVGHYAKAGDTVKIISDNEFSLIVAFEDSRKKRDHPFYAPTSDMVKIPESDQAEAEFQFNNPSCDNVQR